MEVTKYFTFASYYPITQYMIEHSDRTLSLSIKTTLFAEEEEKNVTV